MDIGKILLAWLIIAIVVVAILLASGIVKVEIEVKSDDQSNRNDQEDKV